MRQTVLWLCLATTACGDDVGRFKLPTTASQPEPAVAPQPPPVVVAPPPRFPPLEITTIRLGDVIQRTNRDAPECVDEPGWPCIYYRFTAPGSGTAELILTYGLGTQGNQGVDLTVRETGAYVYVWSQRWSHGNVWLTAPVVEGRSYDITLWYTLPNLDYELRTALK